jgi:DNA polymerase family A
MLTLPFSEVWAVDFEFRPQDSREGNRPDPICLVAYELKSGRKLRLWRDELGPFPPYSVGPDSLFIAYYASAEIGCHLTLGWPKPARILDLFSEFRCHTNGVQPQGRNSLLWALSYYGIDAMDAAEKDAMRDLAFRGGPWSDEERQALISYCEEDVVALAKLLPPMLRDIDLPRALLRGRYMAAAATMEHNGVPIDVQLLTTLRARWGDIQDQLIADIDSKYGVYDGHTFKADRFAAWLAKMDIPWPRLDTGRLDLSDDTFRQQAKAHPAVSPLRELRSSLSELRLEKLAVGSDGRNRVTLSAFQSRTGRNQPSNSRFIFGPSVWLRGLIKPPVGMGLAYFDWSQQEFGIAAALSGDQAMMDAYRSGDPYLAFAKQAGAVPAGATKHSHGAKREQFKACVLAVLYGMEAEGLASRIGQPTVMGRELVRMFRETYKVFWRWSNAVVDHAELHRSIETVFGWSVRATANSNPRFHRNFLMQGTGAEMLRIACCLATERGVEVCAPVHDAVLIATPLHQLDDAVLSMREAMGEASAVVLAGFELGTDVKIVRYPNRYSDPRGEVMWARVMKLIGEVGEIGVGGRIKAGVTVA